MILPAAAACSCSACLLVCSLIRLAQQPSLSLLFFLLASTEAAALDAKRDRLGHSEEQNREE